MHAASSALRLWGLRFRLRSASDGCMPSHLLQVVASCYSNKSTVWRLKLIICIHAGFVRFVQPGFALPAMARAAPTGRSHSKIAFPLASGMRAAKPLHVDERAQDTIDEAAADSGKAIRAAPRTGVCVRVEVVNARSHVGADDRFRRVRRLMEPDANLLKACRDPRRVDEKTVFGRVVRTATAITATSIKIMIRTGVIRSGLNRRFDLVPDPQRMNHPRSRTRFSTVSTSPAASTTA
jgi:hypothetical protein